MADEFDIPDFSKQTSVKSASDSLRTESEQKIQQIFTLAAWSVLLGLLLAPIGVILAVIALIQVESMQDKLRVHKLAELQKRLSEAKTCAYFGLAIGIGIMVFSVSYRLQLLHLPTS